MSSREDLASLSGDKRLVRLLASIELLYHFCSPDSLPGLLSRSALPSDSIATGPADRLCSVRGKLPGRTSDAGPPYGGIASSGASLGSFRTNGVSTHSDARQHRSAIRPFHLDVIGGCSTLKVCPGNSTAPGKPKLRRSESAKPPSVPNLGGFRGSFGSPSSGPPREWSSSRTDGEDSNGQAAQTREAHCGECRIREAEDAHANDARRWLRGRDGSTAVRHPRRHPRGT